MNIHQAIMHSRIQRGVGGALLLSGATFYFISLLMAVYRTAQAMSNSALLWQLGAIIQKFIVAIYQATSPYIGFVWHNVPTINQADPFTYGNLLFLGLFGVMIVGKQLVLTGRRLKGRIQRQIDRVEDLQWRNSMMQNRIAAEAAITSGIIEQVNIFQQPMPPSAEGKWWTRPWGIVGLSIISGYIVAVMAKITGMI